MSRIGARLQPLQGRIRAAQAWLAADRRHWVPVAGVAGAAVIVGAALVGVLLTGSDGDGAVVGPVAAVSVSPSGEIPRLGPITISFEKPPEEQDAAQLVRIEPATEGAFVWVDDRTLLFQPAFPGLVRGADYTIAIAAARAGLNEDFRQTFVVEGQLKVTNVIPADRDTEVPVEGQILVQFSRSVAPLTVLSEADHRAVLVFDPPLAGTGEWLNTSLYHFVPSDLQPSSTYTVRVTAGLTAAVDGVLEEDFVWTFATVQPALARSTPADNTDFVSLRSPVVLTFNQPMDLESVRSHVEVRGAEGELVAGAFTDDGPEVTFTPDAPFGLDAAYVVAIPAGVQGAVDGETRAERRVEFRTVGPPGVAFTSPDDGEERAGRFGVSVSFRTPMDLDSVVERISVSGIADDDIETFNPPEGQDLFLNVILKPSTDYTVTIADGAVDREGLSLGPVSFSFRTGALPRSVSFATPGQITTYSAGSDPLLYFHATNVDEARFSLYRLTEDEADAILRRGYIQNPSNGGVYRPSSNPIRSWSEPLDIGSDVVRLGATSLGDGRPLSPGDYYVVSEGNIGSQLMFSVVDTTIVTKLSNDQLLAWVLDYDTGAPLVGLQVVADGPQLSGSARTDTQGLATFAVPNPRDVNDVERAYFVRLDDGAKRGVASTRWSQGSEPYQLGIFNEYPREYVGHAYTDRPIYRPGETVNFKLIVRRDDDATYFVPDGDLQIQVALTDPTGEELTEQTVTLNDLGTFATEFELPVSAPTGFYFVSVIEGDGFGEFITSSTFQVAEFRVPEFEVATTTGSADYISGETVDVTATATFFFGGPVRNADVTWAALSFPTGFSAEGYEEYSFNDFDFFREADFQQPLRAEGEATTNAQGVATFEVAAVLEADEGTHQFEISTTVLDENAQAVADSTFVTVHPASYYAGIRADERIPTVAEESELSIVTVDTDGQPVGGRAVTIRVYEREWITFKEETDGGRIYRSEPQDTLIDTINVTTESNGEAVASYVPERAGTLRIVAEIRDEAGRIARAATFVWATGSGQASWRVRNDDVLELIANRDSYRVGDIAEVLVPTPFPGAVGLVTVERGKVMSTEVREFNTSSDVLRIPVGERTVPNAFVSVVLYRPPTDEDPIPRYMVGYVELDVSTETRELEVTVEADRDRAAPGETVRFDIQVNDSRGIGAPSEISLAIVDKAVLSLANEIGTDGLRAFWFQRGLGVFTASSASVSVDRANDVITEPEEGFGKGGGGDDARLREDFRNTALWEGQLRTDANGHAFVEVTMPDNLTTWRAQARAVSGDTKVGEGTSELLVTQPLLLRPALPRFLRVGDETMLRALVRNGTTASIDAEVSIEAEGVDLGESAPRTVSIAPDESVLVEWPATVLSEGIARVIFRASGTGGFDDAVAIELPVYLDVTPEATATGGVLTSDATVEAVYLPDYAIREHGSLDVSVQASLVGALSEELIEFRPLASESNERLASRIIATLGVMRAEGDSTVPSQVRSDVTALITRQNGDRGWGWCRLCDTSMSVTGWVLIALGDARTAGVEVPEQPITGAALLIDDYVNRRTDVEHPADPNEHAFLLYAVRRASAGDSVATQVSARNRSTLVAIAEQRRDELTNSGRAYVLMGLLGEDDELASRMVNDLTADTIASANGNHWEDEARPGSLHNGSTRITAIVLRALSDADSDHPLIEETVRWLVTSRSARRWETTIERAEAVSALGDFAASTGERQGDFDYLVNLDEDTLLEGHFQPGTGDEAASTSVPLLQLPLGEVSLLGFRRDGSGRLYYGVNLRYVTPAQEVEALNRGFAVTHEYSLLDDPGRRITSAELGDIVRVTVTIVAETDRNFVVVEDFLPAGLEPIDPQLSIVPAEVRDQLQRERQDAISANAPDYFAPWFAWYFNPWDQVDTRDDRLVLSANELPKGVHEYVYFARATTPGDYFVAPAHVEETFFPEVFARSDSGRFVVR